MSPAAVACAALSSIVLLCGGEVQAGEPALHWALDLAAPVKGRQAEFASADPDAPVALTMSDAAGFRYAGGVAELSQPLACCGVLASDGVNADRYLSTTGSLAANGESPGETVEAPNTRPAPAFRLPPILWRGTLGNVFAWAGTAGSSSLTMIQSSSLSGNSFIWQPWFLKVEANGSLSQYSGSNSGAGDSATKGTGLSGGATLDFFSQSRFPLTLFFNTSESKTKTSTSSSSGSYSLGARGSYTPLASPDNYRLSFVRNGSSSEGKTTATNDRLDGSYNTSPKQFLAGLHTISATAGWARSTIADGSYQNNFIQVNGQANSDYYEDYGIRAFSNAFFYTNQALSNPIEGGLASSRNTVSVFQFNSNGSWTPEDDIPLSVSGTVSFNSVGSTTEGVNSTARTFNGQLSGSYRINQWLGASASLGATSLQADNSSNSSVFASGGLSAGYSFSGEPRKFADFDYNWGYGANAGLSGSTSTAAANSGAAASSRVQLSGSSSFNHRLARNYDLGPAERLRANLFQSVSVNAGGVGSMSGNLSTTATLDYSIIPREKATLTATLNATDNRGFGSIGTDYQTISGTANGSLQLSRFSSATLTLNGGFNRTGASVTAGTTTTTSNAQWYAYGSVSGSYQHGRAFGYKGLRYNASYSLTPPGWGSGSSGGQSPWSHSFSQGLYYRIGRITTSLTNNVSIVGKQSNASVMLNIVREIGNY